MHRPLQPTLNGMEQSLRAMSTVLMEQVLMDLLDLASQVKTCDWIMSGLAFLSLHEFQDKLDGTLRYMEGAKTFTRTGRAGCVWGFLNRVFPRACVFEKWFPRQAGFRPLWSRP